MSKIGMRPIPVKAAKVLVEGVGLIKMTVGARTLEHQLPEGFSVNFEQGFLKIFPDTVGETLRNYKAVWGLHRALVASKIKGLEEGFVSTVRIVGLTYKAAIVGDKISFSLGYSHKVEMSLDSDVSVEIDKNGQLLTLKSFDKFKLGSFCSNIRSLRKPEPYKGTGIFVDNEVVIRKAGKSKS